MECVRQPPFDSRQWQEFFKSSKHPEYGAYSAVSSIGMEASSSEVKRRQRKACHFAQSSAEVKKVKLHHHSPIGVLGMKKADFCLEFTSHMSTY
jgi:hypothetical protein